MNKNTPHLGDVLSKFTPETLPKLSKEAGLSAVDFLEKAWPSEISPDVKLAFDSLKSSLEGKKIATNAHVERTVAWPSKTATTHFDPLDLLRRILMSQDMLFLSRQLTYHIAASSELPMIWADRDKITHVFSKLIEHLSKRADRGSRINIELKQFTFRNGPGIQVVFEIVDHNMMEVDNKEFVDSILTGKVDEVSGVVLSECRDAIIGERGQLWAELPKQFSPIFNIVLPSSEESVKKPADDNLTYKYDISITNYANVRKRFGIKKSASLVVQIENYIKSLVRYPMDMVISVSEKGTITTIYETQKNSAQSVASRISERLGREDFHIGKRSVELSFRYQLSPLKSKSIEKTESGRKQ